MQRYFVKSDQWDRAEVEITDKEDIHHISRVMRMREGDRFICSNGEGRDFHAIIESIKPEKVTATLEREIVASNEMKAAITLAQALPKGDKMDGIVRKATELGASRILPFESERTIVRLDEKKETKRRRRWERIAKEAAEQSQRSRIPSIDGVTSWSSLLQCIGAYDIALLAYELEDKAALASVVRTCDPKANVLVLIGPEGGFSEAEARQAQEAGATSVTLGKRILRTETAGLYVLSGWSFYFEE